MLKESKKCPPKNIIVALEIPHPGHGSPYINLEGQVNPPCPSFVCNHISQMHTIAYMIKDM